MGPFDRPNPFNQLPNWFNQDQFVSSDLRIHRTPQEAIDASLINESAWNTGANCPQDPSNVTPSVPKK